MQVAGGKLGVGQGNFGIVQGLYFPNPHSWTKVPLVLLEWPATSNYQINPTLYRDTLEALCIQHVPKVDKQNGRNSCDETDEIEISQN